MSGDEVDIESDLIPIRDASLTGNPKHRKISIQQLGSLIGGIKVISSTSNPTLDDIAEKQVVVWNNTITNEIFSWTNINGVLFHSPAWFSSTVSGYLTLENGEYLELEKFLLF